MKITKKMLTLMRRNNISGSWLANALGMSVEGLLLCLSGVCEFSMEETRQLLAMFGAEEMARVIDWEGMNVRCPI